MIGHVPRRRRAARVCDGDGRYDLVIFDFDGTLADSMPWALGLLSDIADTYGLQRVSLEEVEQMRRLSPTQIARNFGLPLWRVPAIAADMRQRMSADITQIQLFSGVPDMLRALWDANAVLAVVSSNAEANVRSVLGDELSALVDVFDCGVALFGKASRLRRVISLCEVPPARAIYIGDELRDIEAAKAAGTASGAVTWGYNHADALRALAPTTLFQDVEEITTALAADCGGD